MKKVLRIKQILENRGLKQKWLADKIGVTEVTISNWVNNRTYPSIETLLTISTVLNIEVRDLFE
jgi:putative transcriptional regulator